MMRSIAIGLGMVALATLAGCVQYRISCTPMTGNVGAAQIRTTHRYRIASIHARRNTNNWRYMPYPIHVGKLRQVARTRYPQVFADDGVPVRLHGSTNLSVNEHAASFVILFSLGILPVYITGEGGWNFRVEMGESSITRATIQGRDNWKEALSFLPVAWALPIGKDGQSNPTRSFEAHENTVGDVSTAHEKAEELRYEAIAHGLAVKLMGLEASGHADAAIAYRRPADPSMIEKSLQESIMAKPKPKAYTVVYCKRESATKFTYSFAVKLQADERDALNSFRAVQKEFREEIKSDYLETFPETNVSSLYVDFPEYGYVNGMIEGKAEVLAITPVRCQYDSATRSGRLAVRFNQRQFEAARAWIRKNIETLARDKNIAIETGCPPASATYYSLDEKVDGDVMEIGFKTE